MRYWFKNHLQAQMLSAHKMKGNMLVGIFLGIILGAVCAAGAAWYFTQNSPFQFKLPQQDEPQIGGVPANLPGKPGDKPLGKSEYDFYKMLPEGSKKADGTASPAVAQTPVKVEANTKFYLQVGAYANQDQAENLRAKLMLNGVNAIRQKTRLNDGRILHRIRIGPFARPDEMNPVRARLAAAGLSASVVREK